MAQKTDLQRHLVGPLEALDADAREAVPHRVPAHPAARLDRRAPNVRQDDALWLLHERVVGADVGLARDDVEARAGEATLLQRGEERIAVDDGAPRRVDDVGGGLHLGKEVGADDALGRRGERAAQDEEVALARELVVRLCGADVDTVELGGRERVEVVLLRGEGDARLRGRVQDARDIKAEQSLERELPDLAKAEDADSGL